MIVRGRARYVRCKNVSPYPRSFEIDAEDFVRCEEMGDVVRVIHSHCFQSPSPSEVDLVSCEQTKLPWSIVSVPNGLWCDFAPTGYRAPLIGRQWAHAIADCYTLIRDYYDETLSITLPDFDRDDRWWFKGQNLYVDNFAKAGFVQIPIADAQKHDVLLMQIGSPVINHGAIYLGDDSLLHHLHRRLSCREVWSGYYHKRTLKALRFDGL